MADVEKILRLVQEGRLSPAEADEILAALDADRQPAPNGRADERRSSARPGAARHLRIEITEHGRRVVNLRVPINIASFAAGFVPGLPDEQAERIRESIRSGLRGPIVDIGSDDGERVLIVSE